MVLQLNLALEHKHLSISNVFRLFHDLNFNQQIVLMFFHRMKFRDT